MKKSGIVLLTILIFTGLAACKKTESEEPVVTATDITIDASSIELKPGETAALTVTTEPAGVSASRISWTTDNERVASVDANGNITAVGYGRTFIYASVDGVEDYVSVTVTEPERTYELVWTEEFEGTVLDESIWNYETGAAQNNEKQYYKTDNVAVSDGMLVITAKLEDTTTESGSVFKYTSGRINTSGKKFTKYGKVEARVSVPSGGGTWPAFWMMPNESVYGTWPRSGEIDIMEHVGNNPRMVSNAVHTRMKNGNGYPASNWYSQTYHDGVEDEFHVYGIEWIDNYYNGNDAIIFYYDGEQSGIVYQALWSGSTYQDWPFDQNFYVILNLAIGGNLGGEVDDAIFPVELKVDWVKIYEQK